ncbi:MAG TPA: DUF3990 domain-containing protein [Thermoanaerobaculia bacterium]|jgi:hypothetical protein
MLGAALPAPFDTPPIWVNGPLILYHGTLATHAANIKTVGVNPLLGRPGTDFGRGFYTTTVEGQAKSWAWLLATASTVGGSVGTAGAVVRLEVDRDALAQLDSIGFIRGDYDAEDFWSLVFHCRGGAPGHARPGAAYYDVVYGPVASFWMQRNVMNGRDQISFHSSACMPILAVTGVSPV